VLQIHAFNYIDGLSGEVGDLLLLPGSHKRIYARSAFSGIFGSGEAGCNENNLSFCLSFSRVDSGPAH
jgi:hypothetical protein